MALPDFPNNPTLNEQFTVGTNIYQWDGEKWKALSNADNSLRSQLADVDSTVLVGGVEAGNLAKRIVDVKDFGAVGDGVADDSSAIANAISFCKTTGYGLTSSPRDTFFLGTFPDNAEVSKVLIDFDGFTWATNNCKFTANASVAAFHDGRTSQVLFDITDASNTNIGDFQFIVDTLARDGSDRQGAHAVVVRNKTKSTENLALGTIYGEKLISSLTVVTDNEDSFRHTGITFNNLINKNGYYGLNCANNGDKVEGVITNEDCIRSYFVYGVEGHDVVSYHKDHLKFTDIVIARLSRDTKNISVDVNTNSASSSGVVSLEFLTDDTNGTIEDIEVNLNVVVSNPANPTLKFNDLTAAGASRATTTNRFNNIRVTGVSNSTTPTQLNVKMTGETDSVVYIQPNLIKGLTDTKRFNFRADPERYAFGNAANGLNLEFYVGDLKFVSNWGRLRIWAADNPTASAAEYYAADYWVLFSVGSDGSVNILRTELVDTAFTAGVLSPSISFPAQTAGSFSLVCNVANYTGAGRLVKGELTVFSGVSQW